MRNTRLGKIAVVLLALGLCFDSVAQNVNLMEAKAADSFHPGRVFKDCGDCPEMVVIPAGNFEMGSSENGDEQPVHTVRIAKPFALGKTEVTQGQWRAMMGNNPSQFSKCGDNCPVESVSWNDAQEFIRKLNEKTGKTYRLPSEAEWEYSCRAGGTPAYCGSNDANAVGWHSGNSGSHIHAVAGKQANAFGVYDMSGNVWEWVEDCDHDSYIGAPSDGSAWTSGKCSFRVQRGGSSSNIPRTLRPANRYWNPAGSRFDSDGFRLAGTLF
jgi:formylglycine-generating enzyme required for sulfatase activity